MKTKIYRPKQLLAVYDNGGDSYDRFTIILKGGDVFGSSEDPNDALGFGSFNHNIADERMNVEFGINWRERCNVKKCTKYAIDKYLNDVEILKVIGKKIKWDELPVRVQEYIAMTCDPIEEEVM